MPSDGVHAEEPRRRNYAKVIAHDRQRNRNQLKLGDKRNKEQRIQNFNHNKSRERIQNKLLQELIKVTVDYAGPYITEKKITTVAWYTEMNTHVTR